MKTRIRLGLTAVLALAVLGTAACGGDDGADVRDVGGSGSASGSGSGSGSAAGSGSGSGLSEEEVAGTSDDPQVLEALAAYETYVAGEVDNLLVTTKTFTDAVRAGNVELAKASFAPSRVSWERIEPIAGLIEDIDVAVDARVDDYENVDDPEWTGWHKLEHLLWEKSTTEGGGPLADKLDTDLASLDSQLADLEITPLAMTKGAGELIEEVSQGKITGEEDRYSHTDLWDFAANVDGSRKVVELLTPALEAADADLLADITKEFDDIDAGLAAYKEGEGYKSYDTLTDDDKKSLQADLAALSEHLSQVPGTLGLE
jgi:iron uptake system component EfeO